MRQVMRKLVLAFIAAWAVVSALAFSAQAAPFGSSDWWQEMDREGRGGRG
jgi:Spy/CpxP family protein refolding chaperone